MAIQKIPICDDSETDLAFLKTALKDTNCILVTATNGEEAVKKAVSEKPDVIFLDIVMPEMDGFAACRKLRDDPATKHIPIIFVSSKQQKADRVWAQMQGAKDLIGKPYDAKEVLEKLQAL
jgi:twitching motility two-component system response regulator PilH